MHRVNLWSTRFYAAFDQGRSGRAGGWTDLRDGGVEILQALEGMAAELGVQAGTYETTDDNTSQQFPSLNL
ncbi:MAG: hypothetical protein HOQ44_24975 [Nocardia sp.]|nr:hypothetical protein [Nocardia sp.]